MPELVAAKLVVTELVVPALVVARLVVTEPVTTEPECVKLLVTGLFSCEPVVSELSAWQVLPWGTSVTTVMLSTKKS